MNSGSGGVVQKPIGQLLSGFRDYCRTDERLAPRTTYNHVRRIKRFLKTTDVYPTTATKQVVRNYLKQFNDMSNNAYSNQLASIRVFFRFLEMDIAKSFKFPHRNGRRVLLPEQKDIIKFYDVLDQPIEKVLFLFYASSGKRKTEVLALENKDINFQKRMIIPQSNHNNTKNE